MKLLAAIALATAALVLSAASATAGTARGFAPHRFSFIPRIAHTSALFGTRQATKTAGFNCVSSCASYKSTIDQYFTDVAADSVANATTNVFSVVTQYSNIAYNTTFAGSVLDGSPLPKAHCNDGVDKFCVTDSQLQTEIGKVIKANGWPTESLTTLYFIFTPANVGVCQFGGSADNSNPCTTNAFCAYHFVSNSFLYAVEPDAAAVSGGGCDSGASPAGNNADATINTVSHETIEAITDPFGDGWWTEDSENFGRYNHAEIGDLCAYNYGTPLGTTPGGESYNQVINGHDYWLQQEWSNADSGCVQQLGGTATNFDPNNPLYGGTGPLVGHGGDVMTTQTIYAIYWVPAAPANSAVPKIAGAAQVGKKLKALNGVWSGAPTYTYLWLRCSATGTSCKGIRKATESSYRVTPADAGHRLEVRVTGTNAAGRATATSAPTAKVRS